MDTILQKIIYNGGTPLFVGGYVRDSLMGLPPKDIDIEVYGLEQDQLISILSEFGEPSLVGESFGVIKLGDMDFSLPRRDSKNGKGHKGFTVESDPFLTPLEAAQRRDFTMNSLSMDIKGML